MTAAEIRKEIMSKYHEGQVLNININYDEKSNKRVSAKIVKFNPNAVLTEHNGYKESFTYWDFRNMTTPFKLRKKEIIVTEREGRHRDETYQLA